MRLQAQDMALRRLNVIKNGIDEPDKTILVGCTDRNNLHTRIGKHMLVDWSNTTSMNSSQNTDLNVIAVLQVLFSWKLLFPLK